MLGYELTGPAGAPVLALGGSLGTTRAMWQPQVAALAERFRVLRYDLRGHGGSPVPPGPYTVPELGRDVLRLLDHLGIERCHYAGLSLGGMLGLWLAATAPERIDRLTVLCTAAHLPPADAWLSRARRVRADGLDSVTATVVARWFTPGFRVDAPGQVAELAAMLRATPAQGYAGCCEAIATMDLRPLLARISAPTLVVAGADDRATPPWQAAAIVRAVAGARLSVVPAAAHLANVEQAGVVTGLLLDHLTAGGDRDRPL